MMINMVCLIIGTGITVGCVIGAILKGFFKTNKDAQSEHDALKTEILAQFDKEKRELIIFLDQEKNNLNDKINTLEKNVERELNSSNKNIHQELEKISEKIDHIKTRYVTNENFKTYADAMAQLLKMSSERMQRIENTLDSIEDNILSIIKNQNKRQTD